MGYLMAGPRGGRGGTGGTGGRGGGIGGQPGEAGGRGEPGQRGERGRRGKGAFGWSQAFVYLAAFAAIAYSWWTNYSEANTREDQFCTVTAYQYAQQDRQYQTNLEVLRSPLAKDPAQKNLLAYIRNVSLPRLKDDILRRPPLPEDCRDERLKLRPIPIVVEDLRKERAPNESNSKNRKPRGDKGLAQAPKGGDRDNPPPGGGQPPPPPDGSGGGGGLAAPEPDIRIGPLDLDLPDLPLQLPPISLP